MTFCSNLQFLRAQEGITQEQLAEKLDVSRQSVSKWESGQSFPEMDTLLQICNLYDVSLDVLLRGSVENSRVTDTAQYDRFMNGFTWRVVLSVGGILIGVVAMILAVALNVPEMMATAIFLLALTVASVTLVASGIQYDYFCKRHPVINDFYTQEEKDAFHQKFVWLISGGVGAILFGVVMMLLLFAVVPEREPYESYVTAGFLVIVTGAVMAFIYAGIQEEKYKIWKYNRDNNPTSEVKARQNLIGAVCGVLMLLVTALYVGLGLTQGAWGTAWWVFAVGGILCGAVCVALDPYKGED